MQGTLTLGNFLLIMGYLSQLFSPLKMISKKIGSLQGHLASAERVYEFIDQEQDVIEKPNAIALNRAKGTIQYQNVYFSYDGTNEVLKGITFDVQAGMRIGIAGQTGAGKTTLVSLLTRFYDPSIGKITLDGIDLRDYKIADLRDQFSIMLQEPILFSTTIAENISYAKPDASQNEIEMAARSANIHEFIVGLHDGYNTQVGERGMRLSSGERQRISLARAFLKDAPILILDEPTSSVDIETEVGIMQAIERLMADRTTFIIAHRLSTLENCDELLLIQDGQFVVQTKDVHKTIQKVRLFDKNFGGA